MAITDTDPIPDGTVTNGGSTPGGATNGANTAAGGDTSGASITAGAGTTIEGAAPAGEAEVCRCDDARVEALAELLERHGLRLEIVPVGAPIPGSYWGAPEAGLIGDTLYASAQTPVHSVLHEAAHYACMSPGRRTALHTDAGGGLLEEAGVCYLQVLWADALPGVGRRRLMADMDAWGYSFRLGSTQAWFERDADDAREWLERHGLIRDGRPSGRLREAPDAPAGAVEQA